MLSRRMFLVFWGLALRRALLDQAALAHFLYDVAASPLPRIANDSRHRLVLVRCLGLERAKIKRLRDFVSIIILPPTYKPGTCSDSRPAFLTTTTFIKGPNFSDPAGSLEHTLHYKQVTSLLKGFLRQHLSNKYRHHNACLKLPALPRPTTKPTSSTASEVRQILLALSSRHATLQTILVICLSTDWPLSNRTIVSTMRPSIGSHDFELRHTI